MRVMIIIHVWAVTLLFRRRWETDYNTGVAASGHFTPVPIYFVPKGLELDRKIKLKSFQQKELSSFENYNNEGDFLLVHFIQDAAETHTAAHKIFLFSLFSRISFKLDFFFKITHQNAIPCFLIFSGTQFLKHPVYKKKSKIL
jgi:hypothetical protein